MEWRDGRRGKGRGRGEGEEEEEEEEERRRGEEVWERTGEERKRGGCVCLWVDHCCVSVVFGVRCRQIPLGIFQRSV